MHIALYITTGVIAWFAVILVWQYYQVINVDLLENVVKKIRKKEAEEKFDKFSVLLVVLIFIIIEGFTLFIGTREIHNNYKIKYELILVLLSMTALVDARRKIIPNLLVLGTLIIRVGIGVYEYFLYDGDLQNILIIDGLGFFLGFGILLIVAILTKQAIGYGDVKLFGAIGITIGVSDTYSTLFYGMIFILVASIYLLLVKKKDKKYKVPFAPFIFMGYLTAVIVSNIAL